ncbi:hypothetical protein HHI36_017050 [Cryptolaemus montrouzieri]|uniref:Uncharacterized protein n=1 Tax=Cryptolaemus montrouzieri TaxID=559131 RepID=A0ABD2NLJ1_9CUCU
MFSLNCIIVAFSILETGNSILRVKHYGTIHSSQIRHSIVKRGLSENNHPFNKINEIQFNSMGQKFRLILHPNTDVLHSKFRASEIDELGVEQPILIEQGDFYNGRVFGELSSSVSLHIENGIMMGSIELERETFHIEPSWRHIPELDNRTMIIYKQSDVILDWNKESTLLGARTCGVEEDFQNLDEYSNSSVLTRKKRQIIYEEENNFFPTKTRCSLLLVADYTFYMNMGGSSTKTTTNYLITLIDRVHKIYNNTVWRNILMVLVLKEWVS